MLHYAACFSDACRVMLLFDADFAAATLIYAMPPLMI